MAGSSANLEFDAFDDFAGEAVPSPTVPGVGDFVANLVEIAKTQSDRKAARHVYSTMHKWLLACEYDRCDQAMKQVDVSQLGPVTLVSMLTITTAVKSHLAARAGFFEQVKKTLEAQFGIEKTGRILVGLE